MRITEMPPGVGPQSGTKSYFISRLGLPAIEVVTDTVEDAIRCYNHPGVTSVYGTDYSRVELVITEGGAV